MGRQATLLLALLALPLVAPGLAEACGVPCGRIYPLILIQVEDQPPSWPLARGEPLEIEAMLTYKFDMVNEGYTVASPNEPVVVRFEFPRKPAWAEIRVEPEAIPVDVNNPTYAQPDLSTPTSPQGSFVFTAPIRIQVSVIGQPILRDGYDFAKLLVFAKSSESGLYQSGYGIKEIRVVPEGALHESDVAGSRDVFTASPLPPIALGPGADSFAGTTATFTPAAAPSFWQPSEFVASVEPAPRGRMVLAVHDETGALVASTAPVDSSGGEVRTNVTYARPGHHTATLTLLPDAGTNAPPLTFARSFDVGSLEAEGHVYPKTYVVATTEGVPAPVGNQADALAQFERDIPFFVFDTAQSVSASVTLATPGPLDLGRGLANLQFSLHDPDGNMLQAGSVDPTKPTWGLRVGSVPMDGWYVLRVKGLGTPTAARYDAHVEVNYASAPQARNRADSLPDATGPLLAVGGVNLTLPLETLAVWTPSDVTPTLDVTPTRRYSVTIHDANGTLSYASGIRDGPATFSPPATGTYRAYVYAEPAPGAVAFSPVVRAFTFDVGGSDVTVASTFAIEDGYEAPVSATPTLLGFHAVRILEGASAPTLEGGETVDADGAPADPAAPGIVYVRVVGQGTPPQGSEMPLRYTQTYATPVSHVGPGSPAPREGSGLPIPGIALALVLASVGALAVGIALFRR